MKSWSKEVVEIAMKIGSFYYEKFDYDFERTEKHILSLGFEDIKKNDDGTISVWVTRPGLFIGKRGENIDALEKYLNCKVRIFEEQRIEDLIMPICDEPLDDLSCYMDEPEDFWPPYDYERNG